MTDASQKEPSAEPQPCATETAPRTGWLSRTMKAVIDGVGHQACAERGCFPADWHTRQQMRDDSPDTGKGR